MHRALDGPQQILGKQTSVAFQMKHTEEALQLSSARLGDDLADHHHLRNLHTN